jgi:hypothetical protein
MWNWRVSVAQSRHVGDGDAGASSSTVMPARRGMDCIGFARQRPSEMHPRSDLRGAGEQRSSARRSSERATALARPRLEAYGQLEYSNRLQWQRRRGRDDVAVCGPVVADAVSLLPLEQRDGPYRCVTFLADDGSVVALKPAAVRGFRVPR